MVAAATPYLVVDEASVRHETETEQRTLARLVAEVDGTVVGVSRVRDHGHRTMLMVQVDPWHRRRGVGGALLAAALPPAASTGAGEVAGIVAGDDASQAAARAWGFETGRRHTISAVDPQSLEAVPQDAVPLAALDPGAVHDCFVACAGDDPSGLSQAHTLEEFLREDWLLPTHRPDLGRAVVDPDGRVLAFAAVNVAGRRAWNAFTGTRPDHRGQGLALRVKTAALVALAGAGVSRCGTGNDAENAAMLAVNARLGYRPFAWTTSATRRL